MATRRHDPGVKSTDRDEECFQEKSGDGKRMKRRPEPRRETRNQHFLFTIS